MTKYFNAKVQVVQTRTVHVQVAADSEAAAAELAKAQARLKEPGFSVQDVMRLPLKTGVLNPC